MVLEYTDFWPSKSSKNKLKKNFIILDSVVQYFLPNNLIRYFFSQPGEVEAPPVCISDWDGSSTSFSETQALRRWLPMQTEQGTPRLSSVFLKKFPSKLWHSNKFCCSRRSIASFSAPATIPMYLLPVKNNRNYYLSAARQLAARNRGCVSVACRIHLWQTCALRLG